MYDSLEKVIFLCILLHDEMNQTVQIKDSLGKTTYLYQMACGFESHPEHDKILSTLYKVFYLNIEGFLFDTRDSEPL